PPPWRSLHSALAPRPAAGTSLSPVVLLLLLCDVLYRPDTINPEEFIRALFSHASVQNGTSPGARHTTSFAHPCLAVSVITIHL
ncbi:hypothetical protein C8Q76DRAFT_703262, partial [Earliella scabrosa]